MVAKNLLFVPISLVVWFGVASSPAQALETDRLIQFYQQRIPRDPDDFSTYNRLGKAYMQKARETGDPSYYDLAEKVLQRSLELVSDQPAAVTALTSLGAVALAKHRFKDALRSAQRALELDPSDLSPNVIIGDAYVELGKYEKAQRAYEQVRIQRGSFSVSSRLAYLRFLHGDPEGALQLMDRAIAEAVTGRAPKENIAWSQAEQGDLFFHMGKIAEAETAYRGALKTYPGYHRALASLARVRAAQRQYAEAIDLYQRAIAVVPFPDYVAALGDVYTRVGSTNEATKQYTLVEYIGRVGAVNQAMYNRERALFYADHDRKLKEALDLAQRELEVRGDVYTYDVLAWTLYKNGKVQEALVAMQEALKLGTQDARLFFHAGMVSHRLGQRQAARQHLRRALSLNPYFHVLHAEVAARTLKELEAGLDVTAVREQGK